MGKDMSSYWASLMGSVFGECLVGVAMVLQDLALKEIGQNVNIRKRPWDKELEVPYAIVSPATDTSANAEGSIGQQDVHYRIMVALVRASNQDLVKGLGLELEWRQKIERRFRKQIPFTIENGGVQNCSIAAGEPFIPEAFLRNVDAQYLLIDLHVKETP